LIAFDKIFDENQSMSNHRKSQDLVKTNFVFKLKRFLNLLKFEFLGKWEMGHILSLLLKIYGIVEYKNEIKT